jgi:hypothetical protein
MTLILQLSDNKEAALKAKARTRAVSAEQFVQRIVDRELERPESSAVSPAKRRISERIAGRHALATTPSAACANSLSSWSASQQRNFHLCFAGWSPIPTGGEHPFPGPKASPLPNGLAPRRVPGRQLTSA